MKHRCYIAAALFGLLHFSATPLLADGEEVYQIDIKKYKFTPYEIKIKAGGRVRWVNREKRQYHSVWFEERGEEESEYFFPDESYERVFDKPGVFPYRCGPHKEMTGVIIVE